VKLNPIKLQEPLSEIKPNKTAGTSSEIKPNKTADERNRINNYLNGMYLSLRTKIELDY
jgi:hypothetical protein